MKALFFLWLAALSAHASPRPLLVSPEWLEAQAQHAVDLDDPLFRHTPLATEVRKGRTNPASLLDQARKYAEASSVIFDEITDTNGSKKLVFSPVANGKVLNELALDLKNYSPDARLVYSPQALITHTSNGVVLKNNNSLEVCIDESTIILGRISKFVVHEMAHAANAAEPLRGPTNAFFSWLQCKDLQMCLDDGYRKDIYSSGLTLDELSAYYTQAYFELLVLKNSRLPPYAQFRRLLSIKADLKETIELAGRIEHNLDKFLDAPKELTIRLFTDEYDKTTIDIANGTEPIEISVSRNGLLFVYAAASVPQKTLNDTIQSPLAKTAVAIEAPKRLRRTKAVVMDFKSSLEKISAASTVDSPKDLTRKKLTQLFEEAANLYRKIQYYQTSF